MRILFLGDVVGRPGRRAVARLLPRLIDREGADFVIANCENASGGKGIDPDGAEELYDAGVDVLTSGNHVWQHTAIVDYMREHSRLLRPANFPVGVPGVGFTVQRARRGDVAVGVVNVIGRGLLAHADCTFRDSGAAVAVARDELATI